MWDHHLVLVAVKLELEAPKAGLQHVVTHDTVLDAADHKRAAVDELEAAAGARGGRLPQRPAHAVRVEKREGV